MGKPLGNKHGYVAHAPVDENEVPYGVKHTNNAPHVILSDGTTTVIVDDDGRVGVDSKDWFQRVVEGEIPGYSVYEKFGENPEVTTATDPEDVWDYGGIYNFSTTADIDSISSSDDGNTQSILIQGLDSDWNEVSQYITLTGQTPADLTTNLIRVYRMVNMGATDLAGTVYCYVSGGTVTAGVPQVAADVRAIIINGNNQTLMCVYTVPAGKTGYFWGGYVSMSRGVSSTAFADFTWRARLFGGVFAVKSRISAISSGRSSWDYTYKFPLSLPEKTDIVIRVEAVSATVGTSGGFTVLLKDN